MNAILHTGVGNGSILNFTPHEMQVSYYQHVAANSKNIILQPYGYTNQKRPLQLAFISTEANLAKLEAIRQNNLRRAGLLEGNTDPSLDNLSIVWLSYSVHGNEAAGAESCLKVVYELVNPQNRSENLGTNFTATLSNLDTFVIISGILVAVVFAAPLYLND